MKNDNTFDKVLQPPINPKIGDLLIWFDFEYQDDYKCWDLVKIKDFGNTPGFAYCKVLVRVTRRGEDCLDLYQKNLNKRSICINLKNTYMWSGSIDDFIQMLEMFEI